MSRIYFASVLFVLLVLEGSLVQYLLQNNLSDDLLVIPRFLIVIIVMIGIFVNRHQGLAFGFAFGLLYDVVYTNFLGVYTFGFAFLGYALGFSVKSIQDSALWPVLLSFLGVLLFEYYQYGMFLAIGVTELSGGEFFSTRLLPTLLLNSAFAILFVLPFRKLAQHVNHQASIRQR
ncbi:rod shape-determining protein MreD [Shouchella shacheensis]|uniref:rod shape-determining protein MreD n=1 Tax=Shouchella shacheensis TaxID=1649580 RepID=UPI00073FF7E7|nr:rod shape-determining protein MreD [Shouchella shacheensis]